MNKNLKIITTDIKENKYFYEETVEFGNISKATEASVVNIYDDVTYQEIIGFGGAITESSAYNYSLLSEKLKKDFIKYYFDKKIGIAYNFGRLHINSCDFSLDIYSYVKDGDKTLETFNISRDKKYIIPLVKDIVNYCKEEVILFASPWSPPAYMKDNNSAVLGGKLKDEYKELWAYYFVKYIKEYLKCGINISAVTVQNEPIAIQNWESCYYSPYDEKDFIKNYLIPVFDREGLNNIKIILWDHNKERVYDRTKCILKDDKIISDRVWAVGHHWYSGNHFDSLRIMYEQFKKPTICTEFCCSMRFNTLFDTAEKYCKEISGNLNNYCIASSDWNILLSKNGGPYHNRTDDTTSKQGVIYNNSNCGCYAPIMLNETNNELILTPIYYYIGHFSKYIKRGAKRLGTTKYTNDLEVSAFINTDKTIVSIIANTTDSTLEVNLRINDVCTKIIFNAHSIKTIIYEI